MRIGLSIALLLVAMLGCGDDTPSQLPDFCSDPDLETMECTLDAKAWRPKGINANKNADGFMTIVGVNGCQEFHVGLYFPASAGEHVFGADNATRGWVNAIGGDQTSWSATVNLGSGSVTVGSVSADRVSGTFFFTAERTVGNAGPDEIVVTEGQFDLLYQGN